LIRNDVDNDNHAPKKLKLSAVDRILNLCPGSERLPNYYFEKSSLSSRTTLLNTDKRNTFLRHFINAIGHPSILKQISEKFLENVSNERELMNGCGGKSAISQTNLSHPVNVTGGF